MPYNDKPKGDAPDFVYTIYIAASITTVWDGLINKEVTQKYWGRHNKSDWEVGSKWEHTRTDGSNIIDIHGEVLEVDPPKNSSLHGTRPTNTKTESPLRQL